MTDEQTFNAAAESSTATDEAAAPASRSSGSGRGRHRKQDSHTQETSSPGNLGQVVATQAQEQAVKITREARRQATTNLEKQTRRAARIVGALGTALHQAGAQLRAEDEPMAASYYDMAGDKIDHLASGIAGQDADKLLVSAQQFAQRQPMLLFGTAAVIGVLGVRVLRSSSPSSDQARGGHGLQAGAH